ncbi:MAG: flagellar basal body protein [Oscillospiraceae bacterium]|nr:flagellar basal body protein [Oscillospiraceae bacterium]
MASSFMGLYVQREALNSAQKALDITGNNISNVKTAGYSRQRLDVCSIANTGYNLLYNTGVSLAGQGVDNVGVGQYRDALIDEKVRSYTTLDNNYNIKDVVMKDVETALDNIESKEYGFAANLANFKSALQSFATDEANRKELANVAFRAAESVTQQIRYMNSRLDDISNQTKSDANISVDRVNKIFESMANLNKQITNSYIQMNYMETTANSYQVDNDYGPLELKDQMNLLIDELASFGDVSFNEESNGSFTITFAGQVAVHNDEYAQMTMTIEDPDPLYMGFKITNAGKYIAKEDRYDGLMNADLWKKLATNKGMTNREYVQQTKETIDITGKDKLQGGALRGYLDVYNGEGVFNSTDMTAFNSQIKNYPDEINSLLKDISGSIAAGDTDKADEAVEKLKEYGEVDYDAANGTVKFGGETVVDANGYAQIALKEENTTPGKLAFVVSGTKSEADWTAVGDADAIAADVRANGTELSTDASDYPEGSKLGEALTQMNVNVPLQSKYANDFQGIEYYRDMLNAFTATLTKSFNEIYKDFKDADGNPLELFTYTKDDGSKSFRTAAADIKVTDTWRKLPSLLAQPEQYVNGSEDDMDELNNDYIHKCLAIFENVSLEYGDDETGKKDPLKMTLEKFVSHISDNLGTQIEGNAKILKTTDIMLESVNDARDEIMGVSVNEEGINMLNYQKWYNAIARMVTTLDEALDKMINDMGVVGR